MSQIKKGKSPVKGSSPGSGAIVAKDYFRAFALALADFENLNGFCEALERAVQEDPYLFGRGVLFAANEAGGGTPPDFKSIQEGDTVLAVSSSTGNLGHLVYQGRRDKKPFGPEDLYLMGAIAEFVSALVVQSRQAMRTRQTVSALRFILDQLPLGVVCFAEDRSLLASNKVADGLVGDSGFEAIGDLFLGKKRGKLPEHSRFHFEADGRLVYAEGRSVALEGGGSVIAYLLYDMGSRRERLLAELDRQSYRSHCLDTPYTVAFFESKDRAGAAYAAVKAHAKDLQVPADAVQPIDAYTCACLFAERNVRSVRFLLQCHLERFGLENLRLAVVPSSAAGIELDAPGVALLEAGRSKLAPASEALRPQLACLEAYGPVFETLHLILEDVSRLQGVATADEALRLIADQQLDGIVFDLDGNSGEDLVRIREATKAAGEGFRVFYSSYTQPEMARKRYGLAPGDTVLQKPFDAEAVAQAVHLQFNLA